MSKQLLFDGILHIRAVSGEQLADRDTFTKQDPYVKMTVYNSSKKVREGGGWCPLLDTIMSFSSLMAGDWGPPGFLACMGLPSAEVLECRRVRDVCVHPSLSPAPHRWLPRVAR